MKNLIGYLLTGIRLGLLFRLIKRNKVSFFPLYFVRLLLIIQNACWSSLFSLLERKKWNKEIFSYPAPVDPVFIIGHWRTGSTYLHQLLNMHEQLAAPTLFQTSQPEGFIKARPYYSSIMKVILGKTRPFDQLKIGIDEAQEDEFALFRLTGDSPLESLIFPENGGYFLLKGKSGFFPKGEQMKVWEEALKFFYRKIAWHSGKRLLLKNPFHSMRISYLREQYPNAKFIHIYRNPLDVVPSTVRMWSVVGRQNAMNRRWHPPASEEVAEFYAIMQTEIMNQLTLLPPGSCTEVQFEVLESDPVGEIKRICHSLGFDFTEQFEQRIRQFLRDNRDFEKNKYLTDDKTKAMICKKMKAYMEHYSYPN